MLGMDAALITFPILIGVETTTQLNFLLRRCAALVAVVDLVGKTMETRVMTKEKTRVKTKVKTRVKTKETKVKTRVKNKETKEEKKMILLSVLTQMFALMEVLSMIMLVVAALNTFSIAIGAVFTTQMNSLLRRCAVPVTVVMELGLMMKETKVKTKEKIKDKKNKMIPLSVLI